MRTGDNNNKNNNKLKIITAQKRTRQTKKA